MNFKVGDQVLVTPTHGPLGGHEFTARIDKILNDHDTEYVVVDQDDDVFVVSESELFPLEESEINRHEVVRVIVAALNANGEPAFYFCKVNCTPEQRDEGTHYVVAENMAINYGYEPRLTMDEFDVAGKTILDKFTWESANVFTL